MKFTENAKFKIDEKTNCIETLFMCKIHSNLTKQSTADASQKEDQRLIN